MMDSTDMRTESVALSTAKAELASVIMKPNSIGMKNRFSIIALSLLHTPGSGMPYPWSVFDLVLAVLHEGVPYE